MSTQDDITYDTLDHAENVRSAGGEYYSEIVFSLLSPESAVSDVDRLDKVPSSIYPRPTPEERVID